MPASPFVDAAVQAPEYLFSESPALPAGCEGAILHGRDAKARRDEAFRWHPRLRWRHAERLDRVAGEAHASFPSRSTFLVDLDLDLHDLQGYLKRPEEWWPVCHALRGTRRMLRLKLPPGTQFVAGAKQVVRRYLDTRFWLDPFAFGPLEGWQAHVRLAENENVYLTTLGLFDASKGWTEDLRREALHFLIGEVGAATLLYASGLDWDGLLSGAGDAGRAWLRACGVMDEDEAAMVLADNARGLMGESDLLMSVLP
ncbi:MAG: hypothetical protein M5U26_26850 [Planctomycetota bacterium]|nr:hypothetical protein [Planctomycetota bacterium]